MAPVLSFLKETRLARALLEALTPSQRPVPVPVERRVDVEPQESTRSAEELVEAGEGGKETEAGKEAAPTVEPEQVAERSDEPVVDEGLAGRLLVSGGRLRVFSDGAPQWSMELSLEVGLNMRSSRRCSLSLRSHLSRTSTFARPVPSLVQSSD